MFGLSGPQVAFFGSVVVPLLIFLGTVITNRIGVGGRIRETDYAHKRVQLIKELATLGDANLEVTRRKDLQVEVDRIVEEFLKREAPAAVATGSVPVQPAPAADDVPRKSKPGLLRGIASLLFPSIAWSRFSLVRKAAVGMVYFYHGYMLLLCVFTPLLNLLPEVEGEEPLLVSDMLFFYLGAAVLLTGSTLILRANSKAKFSQSA